MGIAEILALIGVIITVIGGSFAILAYVKPRKRQKLLYQTSGIQYFEEGDYALPSDVVMTFQGQKVARLAKTTFMIWNGGTEVLRGEDIVEHDPIRVSLPSDGTILSYSLLGGTNEGNRTNAEIRSCTLNELIVKYDYLNSGDGMVIQVLHNTKQSDPNVIGAAKGLAGGPQALGSVILYDHEMPRRRRRLRFLIRFILLIGFVIALLGTLRALSLFLGGQIGLIDDIIWFFSEKRDFYEVAWMISAGFLYMSIPLYDLWTNRRRYPRSLGVFLQAQGDDATSTQTKGSWLIWRRSERETI